MSGNLDILDLQESRSLVTKGCRNDPSTGVPLTVLEKKILKLLAHGKSTQEISKMLCVSIRTLYDHHIDIMNKLNFTNPNDMIKYVINEGYRYKEV